VITALSHRENLPTLVGVALPEADRPHLDHLKLALESLAENLRRFWLALALYEWCETEILQAHNTVTAAGQKGPWEHGKAVTKVRSLVVCRRGWQEMAKREGAMTIFDFSSALDAVKHNRQVSRTLCDLIDGAALEKIISDFRRRFPFRDKVRHAAAHSTEIGSTVADRAKNSIAGSLKKVGFNVEKAEGLIISGHMHGRTVAYTIEGMLVTCDLTSETLDKLKETQQATYGLLKPTAQALWKMKEEKDGSVR
jgi:hypothetical protein